MVGEHARELYDYFVSKLQEGYESEKVKNGVFQAMMEVGLINDGPVGGSTTLRSLVSQPACFLLFSFFFSGSQASARC
jgi:hypothetical protein